MEGKTLTQILEEVKEDICDNYCKYRDACEILIEEEELDDFTCPLDRL